MPPRNLPNWLRTYLDYTRGQASPGLFHLWTGLSVLSAATLRNLRIDFGFYRLFPNLFVILVAPPGRCYKTTCLNIGLDLLREIHPTPNFLCQKLTPEYLISRLSEGAPQDPNSTVRDLRSLGVISADEVGTLLTKDTYRAGIYQVLCALYDSHDTWSYGTRKFGQEELKECSLVIMAGTTPKWIRNELPSDIVGEGFAARVIFVYRTDTDRRIDAPVFEDAERTLKAQLIMDLQTIADLEGTLTLSVPATTAFANIRSKTSDDHNLHFEGMEEYSARREHHLLKLAILLSVSRSDKLVIELEDVALADQYLLQTELGLQELYRLMHSTQQSDLCEFTLRALAKLPGGTATRTDLMRRVSYKLSSRELDQVMETLVGDGRVTTQLIQRASGQLTRVYRLVVKEPVSEKPISEKGA